MLKVPERNEQGSGFNLECTESESLTLLSQYFVATYLRVVYLCPVRKFRPLRKKQGSGFNLECTESESLTLLSQYFVATYLRVVSLCPVRKFRPLS